MFTITKQFTNNLTGSNVENFEVYADTVLDPGNSGSASFATHLDAFAGSNAVLLPGVLSPIKTIPRLPGPG